LYVCEGAAAPVTPVVVFPSPQSIVAVHDPLLYPMGSVIATPGPGVVITISVHEAGSAAFARLSPDANAKNKQRIPMSK
jgi:hypothetical protein